MTKKALNSISNECQSEINQGKRFAFGRNWSHFLTTVNNQKIQCAMDSLKKMLQCESLKEKTFLDIGCGSGLSSLAARKLGAQVYSFDYDNESVACTKELKNRYFPEDDGWTIQSGSALNTDYLKNLGQFDIVYSWGVLHHTGNLWKALVNILINLKQNGKLYIAIYNDQGWISQYWKFVKRNYCASRFWKIFFFLLHLPYPFGASFVKRLIDGRLFNNDRGMALYYDYIDWLGGYPFEVASVQKIESFYAQNGLRLINSKTTRRSGCNELVFC